MKNAADRSHLILLQRSEEQNDAADLFQAMAQRHRPTGDRPLSTVTAHQGQVLPEGQGSTFRQTRCEIEAHPPTVGVDETHDLPQGPTISGIATDVADG